MKSIALEPAIQPSRIVDSVLRIDELQADFEARLRLLLPGVRHPQDLVTQAMREAVLSPGKRIRPLLMLLACRAWQVDLDDMFPVASAWHIGQAFHLLDDLKDTGALPVDGKDVHRDGSKPTLLAWLGPHEAQQRLNQHIGKAIELSSALFPRDESVSVFLQQMFHMARSYRHRRYIDCRSAGLPLATPTGATHWRNDVQHLESVRPLH